MPCIINISCGFAPSYLNFNFYRFEALVSGKPLPEVSLYKDGNPLNTDQEDKYKCMRDDYGLVKFVIQNVNEQDDAEYMMLAENLTGEDKCVFELFVERPGNA